MAQQIRRALISVSDKSNLVPLGSTLQSAGVEIISSSGTADLLSQNNISTVEVSDYTGFPEILDGRVKTLHPKIHGGLLQRGAVDASTLNEHSIYPIDLLVVNLYAFADTIAHKHSPAQAIEQIDIGGVTLIRAAAKNYQNVIVIVDPQDYHMIISALENGQSISEEQRLQLALKSFAHTATYDSTISHWFANQLDQLPESCAEYSLHSNLRYGENPHQKAAFYTSLYVDTPKLLQGKELSFNNYLDADSAFKIASEMNSDKPCCAIVKHNNPCGVAISDTLKNAYQNAYRCDSMSAYGGIIALNKELDEETAQAITDQQFVEVITAPSFSQSALNVLSNKPNIRALIMPELNANDIEHRSIAGGMLIQQADRFILKAEQLNIVSQRKPDENQLKDLLFAWQVVKHTKSNAIVLAKQQRTFGIGAGQMSRIDSVSIAAKRASKQQDDCKDMVMASDAFFPFEDGILRAYEAGVNAIIQPGGSKNDAQIIAVADKHNIAMVFTGIRHFRH